MVLRVAAMRAAEGAFSACVFLLRRRARPACGGHAKNRQEHAECCPRHGAVRKSCTIDGPCEPSMLHEFFYRCRPQEGLKAELSVQKLQVPKPAVPYPRQPPTYKEQLCLKVPPQNL